MNVIHKISEFWPPFLGKKETTKLVGSQNMYTTLIHTLLRKIEQICEISLISWSGWSDLKLYSKKRYNHIRSMVSFVQLQTFHFEENCLSSFKFNEIMRSGKCWQMEIETGGYKDWKCIKCWNSLSAARYRFQRLKVTQREYFADFLFIFWLKALAFSIFSCSQLYGSRIKQP